MKPKKVFCLKKKPSNENLYLTNNDNPNPNFAKNNFKKDIHPKKVFKSFQDEN